MRGYSDNTLPSLLQQCADDLRKAAQEAAFPVCMQIRAYDALDELLAQEGMGFSEGVMNAAECFCREYETWGSSVESLYDQESLEAQAQSQTESLKAAMNEARFEAASAASLHEFAKEVFDIWQNSGIFARRRALRELRERAGFRLESHRIGNYVAKTFDLMNQAQARFARAQQTVFAAENTYKIKPGIYARLYSMLSACKGNPC